MESLQAALPKEKRDAAIIGTNSSSIVSKRSAERLYTTETQHQYLRYFVRKPQRRSPPINRGYWVRMQAIEYVVYSFLEEKHSKKVIVNLGCGFDPLPFQCLSKKLCEPGEALFVDIDYPDLIKAKANVIEQTEELKSQLRHPEHLTVPEAQAYYRSDEYLALGCDLQDLANVRKCFATHSLDKCAILFIAEVSLTYMERDAVDALIEWTASLPDSRFSILEQILPAGPNNPFAQTMLKHFNSLNTPLRSVPTYPTLEDQLERYSSRGWRSVDICDLAAFWTSIVTAGERQRLDQVEPFDEWEEFYVFLQHYFILYAHNSISDSRNPFRRKGTEWTGGEYHYFPTRSSTNQLPIADSKPVPTALKVGYHSSRHVKRRFGAAAGISEESIIHHGGQGPKTRVTTSLLISSADSPEGLHKTKQAVGARLCHTMTTLAPGKLLVIGGRTSPDNPLSDVWLLENGAWRQVQSLPSGRYRHSAVALSQGTVLVYGGRGARYVLLDEWLLWTERTGWKQLRTETDGKKPCPRFSASLTWTDRDYGIISGGLDSSGRGCTDIWRVELRELENGELSVATMYSMVNVLQSKKLWARFGSPLLYIGDGRALFVGGVSTMGMMRTEDEVVEVHCDKLTIRSLDLVFPEGRRPFLIGHSAVCLDDQLVICGGGGVCFSFSSYFNDAIWTLTEHGQEKRWKFIEEGQSVPGVAEESSISSNIPIAAQGRGVSYQEIPRVTLRSADDFRQLMAKHRPALVQGLDIGSCVSLWTPKYLKQTAGSDKKVVVHVAESSAMSFQHKNFAYKTMEFGEFIDKAFGGPSRLYFRSLSSDHPTTMPANLANDFPGLANDFVLPPILSIVKDNLHSSPLRVSSVDVGMWLHYDGMANALCHVAGRKLFRLYPPSDVTQLSFPHGASTSTILDVFSTPSPPGTTPIDLELNPGDVLYIPPLWLHAAKPLTPCVAVNVFFKNMDGHIYPSGKDVYSNRDMAAYERGRGLVAKVVKEFRGLPEQATRFYLDRLADELREGADTRLD